MKRNMIICCCVILCLAAGCLAVGCAQGGNTQTDTGNTQTGSGSEAPSVQDTQESRPAWAPDPNADPPPKKSPWEREPQDKGRTLDELTANTIKATLTMEDGGIIELELYPDLAPQTVSNFVYLARLGFYDGLRFHRIMSGFMIQGGCPNSIDTSNPDSMGTGNPGYAIWGEFEINGFKNELKHTPGVLSTARGGDPAYNSAGSQFFIMHAANKGLDGAYAAFGKVTSGMDVVDRIAATPNSGGNGKTAPENMPVIKSIVINDDIELPEPEKIPR